MIDQIQKLKSSACNYARHLAEILRDFDAQEERAAEVRLRLDCQDIHAEIIDRADLTEEEFFELFPYGEEGDPGWSVVVRLAEIVANKLNK